MEPKGLSNCLQQPASCTDPDTPSSSAHPILYFNKTHLILSFNLCLGLSSVVFSSRIPNQNPAWISLHACNIPRPKYFSSFGRPNICQELQIMKLLLTSYSPVPYYLIFSSSAPYSRTLSAHVLLWMSVSKIRTHIMQRAKLQSWLYRASMAIKTLYYSTDAQIYNS